VFGPAYSRNTQWRFWMKRIYVVFAALLCCAITGQAQSVSLTGTVSGNGAPIAGARVSVKNLPHLFAITDASGTFSLNGPLPVMSEKHSARYTAAPSVVNNRLLFTTDKNGENVRVDLFSLRGDRVFSHELTNLTTGSHIIPLVKTAKGVYILRFTKSTGSFILKMTSGTAASKLWSAALSAPSAKAAAADYIDTLVVTAPAWRHKVFSLPSYHAELPLDITLSASNPWKPSGSLEHQKGMVKINAKGFDFEMGQPDPNIDSTDITIYEQPINTVQFTYDYWIDTTEVTQKMFDSIMGRVYTDYLPQTRDAWFGLGDRFPVYQVYWGNAALYCNALSKLEGLDTVYIYDSLNAPSGELLEMFGEKSDITKNGYRLPTDAEWEYACRGGTATDYYWGKSYGPYPATAADTAEVSQHAVWWGNSFRLGDGNPGSGNHTVGSTKPNLYGLYEMTGNVTELCHDYWTDDFRPLGDYGTVTDPSGPVTGTFRGHVYRGANWGSNARSLRSSYRNPYFDQPDYTIWFVGFRVVRPVR
jgi:formylglycine-generating enzyme required for sulfatase activity